MSGQCHAAEGPSALQSGVPPPVRTIVIVCFEGCQLLDAAGPTEVFAQANAEWARMGGGGAVSLCQPYRLIHASLSGGGIATSSGLRIEANVGLADLGGELDTVLVAGGRRDAVARFLNQPAAMAWLRSLEGRCRRIGSVCTGAFALAEAGLLDGRRATTHWESCERLGRDYPKVTVEADLIYVVDPPIYTSAGVSAGIDLALSLVESDLGGAVALAVARELVLFLRRPGGQSQFSTGVQARPTSSARIADLLAWIAADPVQDLSIAALAGRAGMSERNFARVFLSETGLTPGRYVESVRVERAKLYLAGGDMTIDRVAELSGLGSADSLQRIFRATVGITPSNYRERFRTTDNQAAQPGKIPEEQ